MPFNWNGDFIESKANKNTDILGNKEIGGVGQLIYHLFRYKDYVLEYADSGEMIARPICSDVATPDITMKEYCSGQELLASLCNLARCINDCNEKKEYTQLILDWCKEYSHPYCLDEIYGELTDKAFDIHTDAWLAEKDGVFSINDFVEELGKLYNAVRYYSALEGIYVADEECAYNLYDEGKFFDGLPFFEKYKHSHSFPDIDTSSANGDLLKEMQIEAEYRKSHPETVPEGEFAEEPYDDYENLRNTLIELIPDFKMRLKVNPQTNRLVFSADVNSVFEIAWYTFARMLTEDVAPEDKGNEPERPEGILICCRHCGDFFIRRNNRQEYCDKIECQRARRAKNTKNCRKRKAAQNKHKC